MTKIKSKNIFIILFIYLILLICSFNNSFNTSILDLIFWTIMIIYIGIDIKNNYIRFYKNKKVMVWIIMLSSIQIIFYFYIGFIVGFSKSPFSHNILTMTKNIAMKVIPIIGIEMTRSVLITKNKNNKLAIILLTLLLIMIEINYNILFSSLPNKKEFFEYLCSNILPIISCGIFCTYLSSKGSYKLALIYRLYEELVILLTPILPSLNWFMLGSIGLLSPFIIYVIFEIFLTNTKRRYRKKRENVFEKGINLLAIILLVTLVFFMIGAFKYEPIAIISNSMVPTFNRGDVIIFKKIDDSELSKISKNMIVVYTIMGQNIAHRVIDKVLDNNTVLYQTKGDNNNVADTNLVKTSQIQGVYVFHIKYIGLPSVWLHEFFNN